MARICLASVVLLLASCGTKDSGAALRSVENQRPVIARQALVRVEASRGSTVPIVFELSNTTERAVELRSEIPACNCQLESRIGIIDRNGVRGRTIRFVAPDRQALSGGATAAVEVALVVPDSWGRSQVERQWDLTVYDRSAAVAYPIRLAVIATLIRAPEVVSTTWDIESERGIWTGRIELRADSPMAIADCEIDASEVGLWTAEQTDRYGCAWALYVSDSVEWWKRPGKRVRVRGRFLENGVSWDVVLSTTWVRSVAKLRPGAESWISWLRDTPSTRITGK